MTGKGALGSVNEMPMETREIHCQPKKKNAYYVQSWVRATVQVPSPALLRTEQKLCHWSQQANKLLVS